MSNNTFGQPAFGAPQPAAPEPQLPMEESAEKNGNVKKWGIIGGVAVLCGAVAVGGLMLAGGDDSADDLATGVVPKAAAAPAPATTQAPAPLPTLAEFNGRNPFKAKIVEGTGGSGGSGSGSTGTPTSGSGSTGGSTGGSGTGGSGGVITLPGAPGPAGKDGARGQDGVRGEDGDDAPYLYAMLIDVDKDGNAMFAFGAGLDFKIYMAPASEVNPDGTFYEFAPPPAEGDEPEPPREAGVPGKWARLVEAKDGKPDKDAPKVEVEDDGTVGDTATILFGDQIVDLVKWVPAPLLQAD